MYERFDAGRRESGLQPRAIGRADHEQMVDVSRIALGGKRHGGALGDGGAIVTNDGALADRLRRLRNGGQTDRYLHGELGVNSRLDEMQAAILGARLPLLRAWTDRRRALAATYRKALAGTAVALPTECDPGHVYHLFVIRAAGRARLQAGLTAAGVETLVHYPMPIPRQPAFARFAAADHPAAACVSNEVLSLPLHPRLTDHDVEFAADAIRGIACAR